MTKLTQSLQNSCCDKALQENVRDRAICKKGTAQKVSVFGVILVCIPHSD